MTHLATLAELEKLADVLPLAAGLQAELRAVKLPSLVVRDLRQAISETHYQIDEPVFRRLAWFASRLPDSVVRWLSAHRFGPLMVARVACLMAAKKVARIAAGMPAEFVAEVCEYQDPRYARDIISLLPTAQVVNIAQVLVSRGAYITIGRFVDFLSDEKIQAVIDAIDDEEIFVRIAYYVESRNRLDHVVRLMPHERLRRAILLVLEPERDVMLQLMSLVFHVSYTLQHELAELAAAQEEGVLNEIVRAAHGHDLWGDLLPVIALLSEENQRKVANLPILRENPDMLGAIFAAADAHGRWRALLPLLPLMDEAMQEAVAEIGNRLPAAALDRIAEATLMGEMWQPLAALVTRLNPQQKQHVADILKRYGEIDPLLMERFIELARDYGLSQYFEAA